LVRQQGSSTGGGLDIAGTVGHVALAVVGLARLLIERVSHEVWILESNIAAWELGSRLVLLAHAIGSQVMRRTGNSGTKGTRRMIHHERTGRRSHWATIKGRTHDSEYDGQLCNWRSFDNCVKDDLIMDGWEAGQLPASFAGKSGQVFWIPRLSPAR
jgi:hypothetical protein